MIENSLNLLKSEQDWLSRNREQLDARFGESMAQVERGEVIPGDQILDVLVTRRKSRALG